MQDGVALLQDYRLFLDMELIFDSTDDFLYRQKGQLKLDNTVIEEFLPHLVSKAFPELSKQFDLGPKACFAALYFTSTLRTATGSPGILTRAKDQDFAMAKRVYVKASFDPSLQTHFETIDTHVGFVCAECKTNLDKTMFQEASATAHDLRTGVPGAKYLLLCEWLDMTPISTAGTDIDEVLILRKARRVGAQVRSQFATSEGRKAIRSKYAEFLKANPFAADVFERFLKHIRSVVEDHDPNEGEAIKKGYF